MPGNVVELRAKSNDGIRDNIKKIKEDIKIVEEQMKLLSYRRRSLIARYRAIMRNNLLLVMIFAGTLTGCPFHSAGGSMASRNLTTMPRFSSSRCVRR